VKVCGIIFLSYKNRMNESKRCQINGDFVISREIVQISHETVVKWLLVSQLLIIKFKDKFYIILIIL